MGRQRGMRPLIADRWDVNVFWLVLLVFVSLSPVAYAGDCIKLCEGGKQQCLMTCAATSKVGECNNMCYSTYDCPARCASAKSPPPQSQPTQTSAITQCTSTCNQSYSQCAMTCQGNTSCIKACGNTLKSCANSCTGLSTTTSSTQSKGQSTTQEVLNKVDNLNKAIQGIFGADN